MYQYQLKDYLPNEGDDDDQPPAESIATDESIVESDDDDDDAPPPPKRKPPRPPPPKSQRIPPPRPPPRRLQPTSMLELLEDVVPIMTTQHHLDALEIIIRLCWREVSEVHPSLNSSSAKMEFVSVLAQKLAYMDQVMSLVKSNPTMRRIYKDKKRLGDGVGAWYEAMIKNKALLLEMCEEVLRKV